MNDAIDKVHKRTDIAIEHMIQACDELIVEAQAVKLFWQENPEKPYTGRTPSQERMRDAFARIEEHFAEIGALSEVALDIKGLKGE